MHKFTRSLLLSIIASSLVFISSNLLAQDNVGIGTTTPDSTAILDVFSTERGFLPPRLTEQERDAIQNPAAGLQIFNTTDSVMELYTGECWIPTFLEDCDDCNIDMTLSALADTIDRINSDSAVLTLTINQTSGPPQNIGIATVGNLPPGVDVTIDPNPLLGSGTVTIVFSTTPLTQSGTFPISIQTLCGSDVENEIYSLTIDPCYNVLVNNSVLNFDLGTELYVQHPNAPTSQPICVACEVQSGVSVTSDTTAEPAFTTGQLPAGSVVAIFNDGMIIGDGGNGGIAYDPPNNLTGAGFDGGDAIHLTLDADIQNNGQIFGGGGGGSGMAFTLNYTLPPPADFITFGIFLGAGGGGGAGGSIGGQQPPGIIGLSVYSNGQNGTGGILGLGGDGGLLNYPIPITIGPANIELNPNAIGGDGGDYGYPGTPGSFNLTISATLIVNVPFVGQIPIPIVNNVAIPIPFPPPPPGNAGYAIKHNGFNTNIPDNTYQTSYIKGEVGP